MGDQEDENIENDMLEEMARQERFRRELTPQEEIRRKHVEFHEKHKGHESMHASMFLILIIALLMAQIILVEWKKRHYRSYMFFTLLGMWMVPMGFSSYNNWFRFITIWTFFTLVTGVIVKKAWEKPLTPSTPRLVYKWFYLIHKISYGLGIFGYMVMMSTIMGLNVLFGGAPNIWMDFALLLIFYGLYYGVLGRDLAEFCADQMAVKIGYYAKDGGFPSKSPDEKICAICGNVLLVNEEEEGVLEDTFKLSCNHVFHEFCIRGWCIVGKKQTCPFCNEKVDLKRFVSNFWEKPHLLYGQLLDWVRWLVCWQPLIYFLVQFINWGLGLH